MNYREFFNDVASWVEKSNEIEQKHGIESDYFWHWTTTTLARLTEKYQNHKLAKEQAILLWGLATERYEHVKNRKNWLKGDKGGINII